MGEPSKHHFIPRFYLANWAGSHSGKLVEYSIKNYRCIPKPVGPAATGFEFDLYAFDDLPPDGRQHLEKVFFNYADDTASRALQIHLGNLQPWNNELVNAWSRFLLGIHFRHPDAMPELKTAAAAIWAESGPQSEIDYAKLRSESDPATFDEYIAKVDPLTQAKVRLNLIIKLFDSEQLLTHINGMVWGVFDVSRSPCRFLTSDRPVQLHKYKEDDGFISLPISPTKLFVAANHEAFLQAILKAKPETMVTEVNAYVVGRARRFVWAADQSQERFIENRMSRTLEPMPLFPTLTNRPSKSGG
jgi:hypothetical protein